MQFGAFFLFLRNRLGVAKVEQRRMGDKRSNIANNIFFFSEHPQQQMSLLVGLLNEGTGRQVSG
jgi:hypothetical protein